MKDKIDDGPFDDGSALSDEHTIPIRESSDLKDLKDLKDFFADDYQGGGILIMNLGLDDFLAEDGLSEGAEVLD